MPETTEGRPQGDMETEGTAEGDAGQRGMYCTRLVFITSMFFTPKLGFFCFWLFCCFFVILLYKLLVVSGIRTHAP